jgi:hypothetical protein
MPFSYFDRLSAREKTIYRKSDELHAIRLPPPVAHALAETVGALQEALAKDRRDAIAVCATTIANGICAAMGAPKVAVEVLEVRPRRRDSELHGLYTWEDGEQPRIQVWMRTAAKARVVAWKTFLRTLVHELCHHLDIYHFKLEETFHTEGFFKRESSLVRQMIK